MTCNVFFAKHVKTILWSLFIITISFIRLPEGVDIQFIPYLDKIVHLVLYFILGLLMSTETENKFWPVVYVILLAASIEIGQNELTTYRTGDYIDFLAGLIGGVLGLYLKNIVKAVK